MADKIIIEYDVEVSKLEAGLNRIEKDLKGVETASTKQSKKTTDNIKKQDKELKNVSKSVSGLSTAFDRLASNLPFAGAIMQTKELATSILGFGSNAEKAGTKAAGAMKLFGNAIKATGIGLLVAAIGGLISYFKRTDDGATQLAGIMRALTNIFYRIIDPITELGEYIGDIIAGTKSASDVFTDLGNILQEQLINRFNAFSKIASAYVKIFSKDWKQGLKDFANATAQLATGIEDPINKLEEFGEVLKSEAAAAIDFEQRLDANTDAFRNLSLEAAEANKKISQLFLQARNRGLEAEKRQALLVKALQLENQITDKTIALQREKLQLTREEIALEAVVSDASLQSTEARLALAKDAQAFEEAVANRRIQITDEQSQKIIDAQKAIIASEEARLKFQEKAINTIAALNEQALNELVEKQQIANQNVIIEQEKLLLNRVVNEEQAQKNILQAQVDGSEATINEYKRLLTEQEKAVKELRDKNLIDEEAYNSQLITLRQANSQRVVQEEQKKTQALLQLRAIENKEQEKALQEQLKIIDDYSKDITLTYKEELEVQLENQTLTEKEKLALTKKNQQDILNSEIDALNSKKMLLEEAGRETIDIDRQIREKQLELKKTYDDKEIDSEKEKQEIIKQLKEKGMQIAEQTLNDLLSASNDNKRQELEAQKQTEDLTLQNQIASLDKQRNAKIISEEAYTQKKAQLEAQQKEKDKQFALRQFEFEKQLKLRQIAIETAFGIAKAIASKGIPLGLIEAAAIALQGGVQAGIVSSQKPPKFEKGGIVGGKPHSQGGTIIEAEKGEFIINKKATEKYKPLLEEINTNSIRRKSNLVPLLRKGEMSENAQKQLENMMLLKAIQSSTDLSHLERLTKSNKNVKVANSSEIAEQIAKRMNTNNSYIK